MQEGNTINKSTNFTGLNKDTAISTSFMATIRLPLIG